MGNHSGSTDPFAISESWEKGSDFRTPFAYKIGYGTVSDDKLETHYELGPGQLVLLKRLDMGDIIKLGIAEELDFMSTELVSGDPKAAEASAKEAVSNVITKAENFDRMETMVNKIVSTGVLKPKLHLPPLHDNARQKGLIYVDSIPFNDRIELFSVIFESEGLSSFRQEQTAGVGNVEHVTDVQLPPERPVEPEHSDSERVLSQ